MVLAFHLLALLAVLGHMALWTGMFNRAHSIPISCRTLKLLEKLTLLIVLAAVVFWWVAASGAVPPNPESVKELPWLLLGYLALCWLAAPLVALLWLSRRLAPGKTVGLLSNDTATFDVAQQIGHRPIGNWATNILARIPGNQILQLHVHQKVVVTPRLGPALDGLRIAHLSDLHLSGQLTKPFFDFVVDQTNDLDADLVVITGDIVEKETCIPWVVPTFSRLRSRFGVFFVLGNHDRRIGDAPALRRTLARAGMVDLGGRAKVVDVRGEPIILAGNELPWFGPAPDLKSCLPPGKRVPQAVESLAGVQPAACDSKWKPGLAAAENARASDNRPLQILLAHTPDQFPWARSFDFDVMMAGHTHGGQIRLPLIGPVICPSRFGVKYAAGLFYEAPTLMHVSRGISGIQPIRINCPPELALLILRCG